MTESPSGFPLGTHPGTPTKASPSSQPFEKIHHWKLYRNFESSRSGDIVVSAKPGFDLRARLEFPEHRASHGSIIREHISVPIALNVKTRNSPARTADIYPTVLEHMGVEAPENIDGRSLLVPNYAE